MDKKFANDILQTIERCLTTRFEVYEERFLTADELCRQFQMISPSWLKEHGHLLPREVLTVKTKDGRTTCTRYGYPQHKIARMIANGSLKNLQES